MDELAIRIAVVAVALVCLFSLAGIVVVASLGHQPPESLFQIANGALIALVGILVQFRKGGRSDDSTNSHSKDPGHSA